MTRAKRKGTLGWFKAKATAVFSQYIRRRAADKDGNVECITCGKVYHWKKMHAGHYVDGRNNTVLFDEGLTHPQCFKCNMKRPGCLSGNKIKYTIFMMNTYNLSKWEIDALDDLKFETKDMTISDYQEIIAKYSDALVGLDIRDERIANEKSVRDVRSTHTGKHQSKRSRGLCE